MSVYLQAQIKDRMEAKNLTIYALEKKAGLNRSAVRNILQGFSKNPSIEILSAVASALDCTLNDLVGANESGKFTYKAERKAPITKTKDCSPWHKELYIEIINILSKIASEKELELSLGQMNDLVQESYKYSLSKNSKNADKDFCNWLINRGL